MLTYTTILVIFEPRCIVRFTALIVTSLINWFYKQPFLPNHMHFEGFVNLTILIGLGWAAWQRRDDLESPLVLIKAFARRFAVFFVAAVIKWVFLAQTEGTPDPLFGGLTSVLLLIGLHRALVRPPVRILDLRERFYHQTAPIIRVEIITVYFWAALQKLNWDYLDPSISCAAKLHLEIAEFIPFVPTHTGALHAAIWGSLMFEIGIPILFIFPRLRALGVTAAVFFHLWLSLHPAGGIYSFSSLIFAGIYLFMPRNAENELQRLWFGQLNYLGRGKIGPDAVREWVRRGVVALFLIVVVAQAALYLTQGRTREVFEIANRVGFALWICWGLWIGANYLFALWNVRREERDWPNHPVKTPAWIMLAVVVLNGVNPWIGLKTQTSFSMYSNLRSEGDHSNHVFLRRVDLFPLQADLIELIESTPDLLNPPKNPRTVQQFANTGRIFPYFELRRLISDHEGDLRVVYRRAGEVHTAIRSGGMEKGDKLLFQKIPWWRYKFLWFRRLKTLEGHMECTH